MRRKRRTHSPEFKVKAALAAIQGDLTMAELVKKFDVHANQITDWKKQLLSNAPDVFGNGAKKAEDATETIQELHAKIGQLTMENDFLERGLERIRSTPASVSMLWRKLSRPMVRRRYSTPTRAASSPVKSSPVCSSGTMSASAWMARDGGLIMCLWNACGAA